MDEQGKPFPASYLAAFPPSLLAFLPFPSWNLVIDVS